MALDPKVYEERFERLLAIKHVNGYVIDAETGSPAPRALLAKILPSRPRFFVVVPSMVAGNYQRFALAVNEQQVTNCVVHHPHCEVYDLEREDFATPLPYRLRVEFL